jgi:hypothetical protein
MIIISASQQARLRAIAARLAPIMPQEERTRMEALVSQMMDSGGLPEANLAELTLLMNRIASLRKKTQQKPEDTRQKPNKMEEVCFLLDRGKQLRAYDQLQQQMLILLEQIKRKKAAAKIDFRRKWNTR